MIHCKCWLEYNSITSNIVSENNITLLLVEHDLHF